jgi:hypothetical protein
MYCHFLKIHVLFDLYSSRPDSLLIFRCIYDQYFHTSICRATFIGFICGYRLFLTVTKVFNPLWGNLTNLSNKVSNGLGPALRKLQIEIITTNAVCMALHHNITVGETFNGINNFVEQDKISRFNFTAS